MHMRESVPGVGFGASPVLVLEDLIDLCVAVTGIYYNYIENEHYPTVHVYVYVG